MYEAYLAEWEDFGTSAINEVRRYLDRTSRSREIFEDIIDVIPLGVNSNQRYHPPYPIYVKSARGSRIWDVDGNEYIDFNMGYGSLIVGHAHPILVKSLKEQLENGILYTYPAGILEELADIIPDLFNIDMFRFSNSGSEAVMYAIRLARAYTGRDVIVKIEGAYHGAYDFVLVSSWPPRGLAGPRRMPVSVIDSLGLPEVTEDLVRVVPFNDIEPLKALLEEEGDDIAGIILEPIMMNAGIIKPEPGYLRDVKKLAREYDIVLIFDEIKTGMRSHPGTAAQELNIEPDLIVLAKAIGGGFPVSLIGGNEDIMNLIAPPESPRYQGVIHAGTYNANPLALKSVYAVLTEILIKDAYKEPIRYNEELKKAYEELFDKYGIEAYIETYGVSGAIMYSKNKVKNFREVLEMPLDIWYPFFIAMVNNGILPMATGPEEIWTISVQHTERDIEEYIDKLEYGIKIMADARRIYEE